MKTSPAGRAAIMQREGVRLTAYRDSVGILTIGCGHTSAAGPPKVAAGLTITRAQCDEILSRDLGQFEAAVARAVKVPLNQAEFDALVSLAFNIGGGAFARSTVVRKLNAGDRAGAANAFLAWNKAAGRVLSGLTARRSAERAQFLAAGPAPDPAQPDPALERIADIRRLQARLTELGLGRIVGRVDGDAGPLTHEAVRAFQLCRGGLAADGIAGPLTRAALGLADK